MLRSFFSLPLKTQLKIGFVVPGAVVASTGQVLFAINELIEYWGITHPAARIIFLIGSGITTCYVRAKTRYPALVKYFSSTSNASSANSNSITGCDYKLILGIVATAGILAGLSNTIQCYDGGVTEADLITINNENAQRAIASYLGFCGFFSFVAFFGAGAMTNTKEVVALLRQPAGQNADNKKCLNITKTVASSLLASFAFAAFAYFAVYSFLANNFGSEDSLRFPYQILAFLAAFAALINTICSRTIETYKYFKGELPLIPYEQLTSTHKNKMKLAALISGLDIIAFTFAMYMSCIYTAQNNNFTTEGVMQPLSIIASLGAGFQHYVFSVLKILRTDGADFVKENTTNRQKQLKPLLGQHNDGEDDMTPQSPLLKATGSSGDQIHIKDGGGLLPTSPSNKSCILL